MPEERKLVSILFADVTGSTALADSMDAEDVRALMSRYYEHARRIISPYGGTLEKFIGDAIMAVFGLSQVHGDDAERALAAALALREAIRVDSVLAPHIQLRIGVNTGEVVATSNPASQDFLITGDAVNVAARLQQGANPDEIVASERTFLAAKNAFLFEEERTFLAKGKPQPLRIFPLKGPRTTRLVELPPFVGRRQDLLQLDILRERTLEEQRPQLASLVAPAGTGKSRLLEEFLQRLKPADGEQVAFARCLPYGQTLTYWPLRGLLTELLGGAPEKERVQTAFLQSGYRAEDANRLADLVLTTLGMEEKDEKDQPARKGRKDQPPFPPNAPNPPLPPPPPQNWATRPEQQFTSNNTNYPLPPGQLPGWTTPPEVLDQPNTSANPADQSKKDNPWVVNWANLEENLEKLNNLDNFDPLAGLNIGAWLKQAGLDELNALTNSPQPPDLAYVRNLNKRVGEQGRAFGKMIKENVAKALSESRSPRLHASGRESIFTAWRLLIEALASQAPRIIVFEDLHWASDSLLDLVEHIIHLRTSASLLMVALSRPELLDRRPNWGSGRQNFTLLALQPLGETQTRDLIAHVGAAIPADIREQIVARSGGNPFFALELLHAFSELSLKGDAASSAALPDTVHGAVLARLDLLTRQERTVLQIASVASRTFRISMLRAILDDYTEEEVETALDGLLARDMLIHLEGETYNFRHILIRDVAYGTLARGERVRLHSKIALWLEAMAGDRLDQYIELIAYHYREALQLSRQSAVPMALPFKQEDVAPIFVLAGRLAGRAGSFAEANSNFLLAIELVPSTAQMHLHEERGDNVAWGGSIPFEAYSKALECWRVLEEADPSVGARLIRKVLNAATRMLVFPSLQESETAPLRAEGLRLAERAGNKDEQWRLYVSECFDPKLWDEQRRRPHQADLPRLREQALQAASYFEQQQNWAAMSEALDGCTAIVAYTKNWQETLEISKRRLAIPNLPPEEWVDAVFTIGQVYFWLGEYHNGISSVQDALAQLKPGHPVASLGKLFRLLATTYSLTGEWDELIKLLPRLHEVQELVQYDPYAATILSEGYLATLRVALAREDQPMIDNLSTLVQKYAHLHGATFQAYLSALLTGELKGISFEISSLSDGMLNSLLCLFSEQDTPFPDPRLNQLEGVRGRIPGAMTDYVAIAQALQTNDHARLARAINEAEAHQLIPHAARMRIVLAQRTNDPAPLAQARPVLERLGDRQFLRRLAEVAASL